MMQKYSKAYFSQPYYSMNSACYWLLKTRRIKISVNGLLAAITRGELDYIEMKNLDPKGVATERFSCAIPESELKTWSPSKDIPKSRPGPRVKRGGKKK